MPLCIGVGHILTKRCSIIFVYEGVVCVNVHACFLTCVSAAFAVANACDVSALVCATAAAATTAVAASDAVVAAAAATTAVALFKAAYMNEYGCLSASLSLVSGIHV